MRRHLFEVTSPFQMIELTTGAVRDLQRGDVLAVDPTIALDEAVSVYVRLAPDYTTITYALDRGLIVPLNPLRQMGDFRAAIAVGSPGAPPQFPQSLHELGPRLRRLK